MIMCHKCAEWARVECCNKSETHNIRYFGQHAIKHDNNLTMRGIKEAVCIINTRKVEIEYIKQKYLSSCKFIDIAARVSFLVGLITLYVLKCAYGLNQYAVRDRIINHGLINEECPQCSQKEDWAYVIQCPKTFDLKVEFIMEL